MFSWLSIEVVKTCFLGFILFIAFIYQVALLVTLFIKRDQISLVSAIKRGDRLSKAGIFFFVLMSIIVYQALFLPTGVQIDLVYLMGVVIGGDVMAKGISNYRNIELQRIKKTNDEEFSPDDFKDL